MKKIVIFTCLLLSLSLAGVASAAVLVDLDAAGLPEGSLEVWPNDGTAGGAFLTADRTDVEGNDPNAVVEIIDGLKAVSFAGPAWMQSNIPAPNEIVLDNPWSVLTWVYAFSPADEDSIFQWADRGGNASANTAHFNFGTRAFTNFFNDVFYDNAPPSGQWIHLAITYDQSDISLYINGIADNVAGRDMVIAEGHYMRLGRAMPDAWGTHPFDGAIASLQVHDVALTQTEIQQLAGVFEPGTLGPEALSVSEGETANISVQMLMNPITSAGPTEDLEVTLSFAGAFADAQLGTSALGDPYVITVPYLSYTTPISVPITAEDDLVLEGGHDVLIQAVVTGGDPDYLGLVLTPLGGLPVAIIDNDFAPCPGPALSNGAYVDEFECQWDYTLGASSLWTGFMEDATNVVADASVTTSGVLHLQSSNSAADGGASMPFLYVDVTGDFVVEALLSDYDVINYNYTGILVRLGDVAAGGDGEDFIDFDFFDQFSVGNICHSVNNGGRTEINNEGVSPGNRYIRVVREGASFYGYHSPDGVNWIPYNNGDPIVRNDMNVDTLQVGLYQASYTGNTCSVEYDYFSLKPVRGTVTGTLNLTEVDGDSGNVQFQLDSEGLIPPIADIDVTLSAVATVGADPNSDPNDVIIGNAGIGKPYTFTIPAAQYDQPQSVQVTAVADSIEELDQQLTLAAQVVSADPNWTGLLIASDVEINILETPGLLLDIGDGVTVLEGGTNDTFTVRLKIPPLTSPVIVDIDDIEDPNEVTVSLAQLTFDGDWKTPQVVTVTAIDDTDLENDPHATTLSLTATNGGEYDALNPEIVDVTVLENECGAWGYLWGDFDTDCDVDIVDLTTFASAWLDCTSPYDLGCVDMR